MTCYDSDPKHPHQPRLGTKVLKSQVSEVSTGFPTVMLGGKKGIFMIWCEKFRCATIGRYMIYLIKFVCDANSMGFKNQSLQHRYISHCYDSSNSSVIQQLRDHIVRCRLPRLAHCEGQLSQVVDANCLEPSNPIIMQAHSLCMLIKGGFTLC